jgi:hypothetical protein
MTRISAQINPDQAEEFCLQSVFIRAEIRVIRVPIIQRGQ